MTSKTSLLTKYFIAQVICEEFGNVLPSSNGKKNGNAYTITNASRSIIE
jgi:hypothetical protein